MHNKRHWAAVAVLSMACAGAAFAQGNNKSAMAEMGGGAKGGGGMGGGPMSGQMCPNTDEMKLKTVLSFLHDTNQNEIKHAKMALDRAKSQDVKDFADHMVKDHTDADKKLTDLASKKGIDLSKMSPVDPIHAAVHGTEPKLSQALEGKSGTAFESAYIGPEAFEHIMTLAVIDEGMKVAKDDEVKKLLGEMQSTITMHRDHAMKVSDKMKLGTTPAKGIGGGPSEQGEKMKKEGEKIGDPYK